MFRRIALLAGASIAALAISIAPAHADGGADTKGANDGTVWFESYGEHFYVNDWSPDGHAVVGEMNYRGYSENGHLVWKTVKNTPVYNFKGYYADGVEANLSISEGAYLRYRACLVDPDDGSHDRCGSWTYDHA